MRVRAVPHAGPDTLHGSSNTERVPSIDFHPDLRRIARFIPKQVVTPVTLPIMRMGTRLMGRRTP
jgi:hypothetical protein